MLHLAGSESDNDEIDYFADVDHDSHLTDKNVEAAESPLYSLVALPNGQLFDQMTESKILSHLITYLIVISMLTIGLVFSTRSKCKYLSIRRESQVEKMLEICLLHLLRQYYYLKCIILDCAVKVTSFKGNLKFIFIDVLINLVLGLQIVFTKWKSRTFVTVLQISCKILSSFA